MPYPALMACLTEPNSVALAAQNPVHAFAAHQSLCIYYSLCAGIFVVVIVVLTALLLP